MDLYKRPFMDIIKDQELLDIYSKELNISSPLTISQLIASHKFLRAYKQKTQKDINEQIKLGIEQGIKNIQDPQYVKIEDLLKMTLQQICNRYYDDC